MSRPKGFSHNPETIEKIRCSNTGQKRTPETKRNISLAKIGKSPNFSDEDRNRRRELARQLGCSNNKGDNVGIGAKHLRIENVLGIPILCEYCKVYISRQKNGARTIEWANLDHKYNVSKLEDWVGLCRKCHRLYDMGRISLRGKTITERGGTIVVQSHPCKDCNKDFSKGYSDGYRAGYQDGQSFENTEILWQIKLLQWHILQIEKNGVRNV